MDVTQSPMIAAAASWMENFKLPLREIKKRYRSSEIAISSWRSREQAVAMHKKMHKPAPVTEEGQLTPKENANVDITETAYVLRGDVNNGVPIQKKFFDEEGNMTLQQATGKEAVNYLSRLGLNIATMN